MLGLIKKNYLGLILAFVVSGLITCQAQAATITKTFKATLLKDVTFNYDTGAIATGIDQNILKVGTFQGTKYVSYFQFDISEFSSVNNKENVFAIFGVTGQSSNDKARISLYFTQSDDLTGTAPYFDLDNMGDNFLNDSQIYRNARNEITYRVFYDDGNANQALMDAVDDGIITLAVYTGMNGYIDFNSQESGNSIPSLEFKYDTNEEPVPEPATMLLGTIGLGSLLIRRKIA